MNITGMSIILLLGSAGVYGESKVSDRTKIVCTEGGAEGLAAIHTARMLATTMFGGVGIDWRQTLSACPAEGIPLSLSQKTPPALKSGALAVLFIRSTQADQPVADQTNWAAKGVGLSKERKYSGAAAAFRKALADDKAKGTEDEQTIGVHEALAVTYNHMGEFGNAKSEYEQAMALAEKIDPHNTLLRGLLLARLTAIPGQDRSDDRTIAQLRHAIEANRQNASADQLSVMRISLAGILKSRKRYQETEHLLLDSVADLRNQHHSDPLRMEDSLNALGVLRFDQQRYSESITIFRESLEVGENAFGAEHPMLIPVLNNLATGYIKANHPQEGASVLQRALSIASKTLPEDHPYGVVLLTNQALALRKLGRKREAKELELRSKKMDNAFRRRNGIDSTVTIASVLSAKTSH